MKNYLQGTKKYLLLIIIILLAAFLRLYRLPNVPPSASLDEVSIGWNAFSILKTGRDEYKTFFPLTLRAYDDFRPALYVYLVTPFEAVLGVHTLAVRLPSAILSVLAVLATYVLANELFKQYRNITIGKINITIGHIAALLLAISPWHIYISRLGHEVNLGESLLIFGATFFFLSFSHSRKKWFLPLSAFFFALSFGSYQSEKIILPLLVGSFGLLFFQKLRKNSMFVIALVVGILFSLPTVITTFSPGGMTRFSGTSAFTASNPLYESEKRVFVTALEHGKFIDRIMHNPRLTSIKLFATNYLLHFQPKWLFSGGAFDQHKVPYTGLLYWWELPFILVGLFVLVKNKTRYGCAVLLWLFIAPLPAAITTQAPHALRSFTFLPSWQLVEAIGILSLINIVPTLWKNVLIVLLLGIGSITVYQMFQRYLFVFPHTQSESFGYALHKADIFVKNYNKDNAKKVVLAPVIDLQTYMFYLFDTAYDPTTYQKYGGTRSGGLGTEFSFGNVEIRKFRGQKLQKDTIYIGGPKDFVPGVPVIYTANYANGTQGVFVVQP